jgi:hypothetical protein
MYRGLGWRHSEDQPAMADIDEVEAKNITKEGPVGVRILTVEKDVRPNNHGAKYICLIRC